MRVALLGAGAGGVFTSVRDLLHWDENFYSARVGGKALVEQLQVPGANTPGYAWGLQIGNYRGQKIVEHSGSLGGYRAHLTRFPEHRTTIAALCNVPIGPGTLVRRVADVVLGAKLPSAATETVQSAAGPRPNAPSGDTRMDAATVPTFVGTYSSDEIDTVFTIRADGDRLTLQRDTDAEPVALQPAGPLTFRARGFTIRFERQAGLVTSLVVDAGRVRDIRFTRAR